MPQPEKIQVVSDLTEKFKTYDNVYLTDFTGLNVADTTELRRQLREADVEFTVVKNTLAKRAAADAGLENVDGMFAGPTALAFGRTDAASAAKILTDFSKKHKKNLPVMKGGVVSGKVFDAAEVEKIAELPSRDQLLGQLAGALSGPMSGFAGALSAVLRSFANVLTQVKEQKETSGA